MALPPFPATATAIAEVTNGFVLHFTLTSGGFGYTTAPLVSLVGGGGSGAGGTAAISNEMLTSIIVTNAGSGYTSEPAVIIGAPSIQATFLPVTVIPATRLDYSNLTPGLSYQPVATPILGSDVPLGGWNPFASAFQATSISNVQYFPAPTNTEFLRLMYVP